MKRITGIAVIFLAIGCNNSRVNKHDSMNKWIPLHEDSINQVTLTDTLVIFEGTCRGCEYEKSTRFGISDSLEIIKLEEVITLDINPSNSDGGGIKKNLVLVPERTGLTRIKVYKFWQEPETAKDSTLFTYYTINVKN